VVGGERIVEGKVRKIHTFVSKEIEYSNNTDGNASPEAVLLNGHAQCNESAMLAISLLNAVHIDCLYLSIATEDDRRHAAVGVPGKYNGVRPFTNYNGISYYYLETASDHDVPPVGECSFVKCELLETRFYPAKKEE